VLLASCAHSAASALDFAAVAACTRLRGLLRENPDLERARRASHPSRD
jgi:hypothetical protein